MYAKFTCEQCYKEYDHEWDFVNCHGGACHELICEKCARKCLVEGCTHTLCENCVAACKGQCADHYLCITPEITA